MKEITIEQLEQMAPADRTVIDIRVEERFKSGSLPEAINVPNATPESFAPVMEKLDKDKPVCVLCNTGEHSVDMVEYLEERGYDAYNVKGGYRSLLKLQLTRAVADEASIPARTAEAERSLIKKFRKQLWSRFTKAVRDYELIQEGDKVAVCISGGKDSMVLAKLMEELQKHGKVKFEIVYLCMNPGYNEDNWAIVQDNAKILGIPLTVFNSQIFDTVATIEQSPCYLCARMRRGNLYAEAKKLGCNKIALGHHYDDVIETILMGMLYAGKVETMMPKLHSQNFPGMELIRPLYLIREADIKAWRDYNGLHFIQCACRFTENCASCGGGHPSKRDEVKGMIADMEKREPVIVQNIFNSVRDINLYNVIGYHKDGKDYNFLDDYDEKVPKTWKTEE